MTSLFPSRHFSAGLSVTKHSFQIRDIWECKMWAVVRMWHWMVLHDLSVEIALVTQLTAWNIGKDKETGSVFSDVTHAHFCRDPFHNCNTSTIQAQSQCPRDLPCHLRYLKRIMNCLMFATERTLARARCSHTLEACVGWEGWPTWPGTSRTDPRIWRSQSTWSTPDC